MTLLKAFNNHLIEFIEDLIKIYPEDLDLKTSKTFISGIIKSKSTNDLCLFSPKYCFKIQKTI